MRIILPLSQGYYETCLKQLHKAPNTISGTWQMLRNSTFLFKIAFCSHFSGSVNITGFYLAVWACDLFFFKEMFQYLPICSIVSVPPFLFFSFDFSFPTFVK